MDDGLEIRFTNLDTIIDRMSKLNSKVQRSIARRAISRGAIVIREQVKANARKIDNPLTPNNIAENVVSAGASRLGRRNQGVAYRVGIRGGAKDKLANRENDANKGGDTFYWRYLEFGTAKMTAKPFIRPAFDQAGQTALKTAMDEAFKLLAIETAKLRQGQ